MLTPSDLIHLPCPPDLIEAGITFACRSLACGKLHPGDHPANRLRHVVSKAVVELAFRRYLTAQATPYKVLGAVPFTQPDQYDISLGGHRCNLESFLISHRSQITQIRLQPDILLEAPALLPVDQFASEDHKPNELFIFAFLLGVVAAVHSEVNKAVAAGQPVALVHFMPPTWAKPGNWAPLENLTLKSECGMPVTLELGGQDAGHDFMNTTLELLPRQRILVEKGFHSLAYIQTRCQPEARLGIHSPLLGEPYLISTQGWDNIWIYGMDIFLTGWLSHESFRRKARVLNAGMHTFQYDRTRVKNLLVPIVELNPLGKLLEMVRLWEAEKQPINPLPG